MYDTDMTGRGQYPTAWPGRWALIGAVTPGAPGSPPVVVPVAVPVPPTAGHTYDDVLRAQLAFYTHLRGADAGVPRTTVGDIHELAAYWNGALAQVSGVDADVREIMGIPIENLMDKPGELGGMKRAVRTWRGQAAVAAQFVATSPPTSVYAFNAPIWDAMRRLAVELAVYQAAPSRWDIAVAAIEDSARKLPGRLGALGWKLGKLVLVGAGIIGAAAIGYAAIKAYAEGRAEARGRGE
jgi:hypothetical protein